VSATTDSRRGFDALYAAVQPSLWRYAHRLTGDPDVADDVVQESFVRLLERRAPRDDGARLWLFTVVTNLVRDRGRTASRRERLLRAEPVGPRPGPLPSEDLEREEEVRHVREALAQLTERERQLLMMREEGFRYDEIAAVVGVAPGSVGTLIARAVRRFTAVYKPVEG
jgi:RNA polymerase sigma-70 factor, ECF subfamily